LTTDPKNSLSHTDNTERLRVVQLVAGKPPPIILNRYPKDTPVGFQSDANLPCTSVTYDVGQRFLNNSE
jgi:hypothetical protein